MRRPSSNYGEKKISSSFLLNYLLSSIKTKWEIFFQILYPSKEYLNLSNSLVGLFEEWTKMKLPPVRNHFCPIMANQFQSDPSKT